MSIESVSELAAELRSPSSEDVQETTLQGSCPSPLTEKKVKELALALRLFFLTPTLSHRYYPAHSHPCRPPRLFPDSVHPLTLPKPLCAYPPKNIRLSLHTELICPREHIMDPAEYPRFHIFGSLWVEDPRISLDEIARSRLDQYLPLLRALEQDATHRTPSTWSLESAFATLVQEDMLTWSQRGVERPAGHILPPSGSVSSTIAFHLSNPTYHVADPELPITDDPTNPTIRLLHGSGFSSTNILMFDQVCRRGRTPDIVEFYTDEFYQPHRQFVHLLRQNMAAIVEVCWGDLVWKELQRELGHRLIQFPLWGLFRPVRLFLELDEENRFLKRFILRVRHPQFFVRSGIRKFPPEVQGNYRREQDLALTVARRLAGEGAGVTVQYFQTDHPRYMGHNKHLTRQQNTLCDENNRLALEAYQTVFPERYQMRRHREEQKRSLATEMEQLAESFKPMITLQREELSHETIVSLEQQRTQKLSKTFLSFEKIYQIIIVLDSQETFEDNETLFLYSEESNSWEALPRIFTNWIQAQEGLRIGGDPITSRIMLETAARLLHRGTNVKLSTISLATNVALAYMKMISRSQTAFQLEKTIPGRPDQVIQRICPTCKNPVLDDAFPRFPKDIPTHYIAKINLKSNCGWLDCRSKNAYLIPKSPGQRYMRAGRREIDKVLSTTKTSTLGVFFREGEDLEGCAETVRVKCSKCGALRDYSNTRWTIHNPPRFLQPRLQCENCGNKIGYFRAVDPKIKTVTEAALVAVLANFKKVGCTLAEYPKIPEIIFSSGSEQMLTYKQRFEQLKKAKDPSYVFTSTSTAAPKGQLRLIQRAGSVEL